MGYADFGDLVVTTVMIVMGREGMMYAVLYGKEMVVGVMLRGVIFWEKEAGMRKSRDGLEQTGMAGKV